MPLFEVAIIEKPTKKEAEEGALEKLVFGPKAVIAADGQSAALSAVLQNQTDMAKIDPARITVLIRPFQ